MTKKEYMKPTLTVVELKQQTMMLAGSDNYGMDVNLQEEEVVDEAW